MQHIAGIQSDIAAAKYEYWSSFAPLPLEIVLEAGQNAKDEKSLGNNACSTHSLLNRDLRSYAGLHFHLKL